jgi:hypothetical protein
MTETERLQAIPTDAVQRLAVITAERATPPSDERVPGALLQASRAIGELWRTIHDTLAGDRELVASASSPPVPAGRRSRAR